MGGVLAWLGRGDCSSWWGFVVGRRKRGRRRGRQAQTMAAAGSVMVQIRFGTMLSGRGVRLGGFLFGIGWERRGKRNLTSIIVPSGP